MSPLRRLVFDRRSLHAVAAGCVALAAGGVVLLRAPRAGVTAPTTTTTTTVTVERPAGPARAPRRTVHGPQLSATVALSQGSIGRRGGHVYAVVDIDADRRAEDVRRAPIAMALVVDVSGSMAGEKMAQARGAVLDTLAGMRDDDRIALVTYSDSANVVQPLARVGDVRSRLQAVVPTLDTISGTNIPAGLEAGAAALGDGGGGDLVRRVVLVSDGRDGSGQSLDRVANSVRLRSDRGVTLSSLGVGADYDEAYMSRVADAGRGNYEFLRDGVQLRAFLGRELNAAERTNVDRAAVDLELPAGWSLARAYGVEAETRGTHLRLPVGAMSAGDHRRVVLDLVVAGDTDAATAGSLGASLSWRAVPERRDVRVAVEALPLGLVDDPAAALASREPAVFADAESIALAARQQDAVQAWRDGRVAEAESISQGNVLALEQLQAAAPTAARAAQIRSYNTDRANFNSMSAASDEGRAFGLGSNAVHRRAMRSGSGY